MNDIKFSSEEFFELCFLVLYKLKNQSFEKTKLKKSISEIKSSPCKDFLENAGFKIDFQKFDSINDI